MGLAAASILPSVAAVMFQAAFDAGTVWLWIVSTSWTSSISLQLCNGLQEARGARDGAAQGRSQSPEAVVPP